MKVLPAKPFTYHGGKKAVLLLHGFTGNPAHVRMLGKYLQQRGFTCHAPLYKGHGLTPYELLGTGPYDWWKDVVDGYHFLEKEGFKEIAVAGISLGGLFSLKLGMEFPVKGIVTMNAPVKEKTFDDLYQRVLDYFKGYKKIEGIDDEQIRLEMEKFTKRPMPSLPQLQEMIMEVGGKLDLVSSPILVIQGCMDEPLYKESAQMIYQNVMVQDKGLRWYEHSGHMITLGNERETLCEEIFSFLDSLNWQEG